MCFSLFLLIIILKKKYFWRICFNNIFSLFRSVSLFFENNCFFVYYFNESSVTSRASRTNIQIPPQLLPFRVYIPFLLAFRLLLVRARKFIIRDPPRVRAASEKGSQSASPTHRRAAPAAMHACMHASHRIR